LECLFCLILSTVTIAPSHFVAGPASTGDRVVETVVRARGFLIVQVEPGVVRVRAGHGLRLTFFTDGGHADSVRLVVVTMGWIKVNPMGRALSVSWVVEGAFGTGVSLPGSGPGVLLRISLWLGWLAVEVFVGVVLDAVPTVAGSFGFAGSIVCHAVRAEASLLGVGVHAVGFLKARGFHVFALGVFMDVVPFACAFAGGWIVEFVLGARTFDPFSRPVMVGVANWAFVLAVEVGEFEVPVAASAVAGVGLRVAGIIMLYVRADVSSWWALWLKKTLLPVSVLDCPIKILPDLCAFLGFWIVELFVAAVGPGPFARPSLPGVIY